MRLLLDTVALYRAATYPEALSDRARAALAEPGNELLVTLVSAWELALKASLGKLALPAPLEEFFPVAVRDLLARELGVDLPAIACAAGLPRHHGDPFDRLIIAQARLERCAVVTSDARFADYGVPVVW